MGIFVHKAKRYFRFWWQLTVQWTFSEIHEPQFWFQILLFPLVVWFTFQFNGKSAVTETLSDAVVTFVAFLCALGIWFLVCAVVAVFRVKSEERKTGHWSGPVFIFHEPKCVFTRKITPADNGERFKFVVLDIEPNSHVSYKIDPINTGGLIGAKITSQHGQFASGGRFQINEGSLQTNAYRELYLLVNVKPHASAQTFRVYITEFELGKGNYHGP